MGEDMKAWAKGFYQSTAWERTRNSYFKANNGLCEDCKDAGEIVHHIIHITPRNIHDAKVTLSWSNLKLVCRECHAKYHPRKHQARYKFDANGRVIPPRL